MADFNYEEIRQKLLKEEVDKAIGNPEDEQKRVMTSAIPMLAGVLLGNASRGAQMTQQLLSGYEAEKQANKSKLLSYLSKMKPVSAQDRIVSKQIETPEGTKEMVFSQNKLLEKLKESPEGVEIGAAPKKQFAESVVPTGEGLQAKSTILSKLKAGEKVAGTPRFYTDPQTGYVLKENVGASPEVVGGLGGKLNPKQREASVTARKDILADQQYDKVSQAVSAADESLAMLESGSGIAASALGTKIARAMGEVGNLAVAEQIIYKTRPDLASRAKELYANLVKGDKAIENKEDLKVLLHAMREANRQTLGNIINKHTRMYSKTYGVPESEAKNLFSDLSSVPELKMKQSPYKNEKEELDALRKKYGRK